MHEQKKKIKIWKTEKSIYLRLKRNIVFWISQSQFMLNDIIYDIRLNFYFFFRLEKTRGISLNFSLYLCRCCCYSISKQNNGFEFEIEDILLQINQKLTAANEFILFVCLTVRRRDKWLSVPSETLMRLFILNRIASFLPLAVTCFHRLRI